MGDKNQLLFAESYAHLVKGPILEVGSHDYGTTQDFRSLFPPVMLSMVGRKPAP